MKEYSKRLCQKILFYAVMVNSPLMLRGQSVPTRHVLTRPVIEGSWWQIAGNPDLGRYTSEKQQPVDFGIWQAADGTWQLWSCIRNTRCGGHTRLFYHWEGKDLTDKDWEPRGIAMEADTTVGEAAGGLQAPFVFRTRDTFYMVYGDWNNICLASSADGKKFTRVLNAKGRSDLFSGPYGNTRDPMVMYDSGLYYCYYTGHTAPDGTVTENGKAVHKTYKSADFCRVSADLKHWSAPVMVAAGGAADQKTDWFGGGAECPFVVKKDGAYYLFRNQVYGKNNLNTQYASEDPRNFGIGNDSSGIGTLPVAAPEIVFSGGAYYIVALNPSLDGIRVAKLKWEPVE
ncbi:hypothetical protein [Compostibacter hankyongensis]